MSNTPPLDREAKRRLAVIRHAEEATGNVAMMEVEQRLRHRFAQGSCRTRFLRRAQPAPTPIPQESDPLLE